MLNNQRVIETMRRSAIRAQQTAADAFEWMHSTRHVKGKSFAIDDQAYVANSYEHARKSLDILHRIENAPQ